MPLSTFYHGGGDAAHPCIEYAARQGQVRAAPHGVSDPELEHIIVLTAKNRLWFGHWHPRIRAPAHSRRDSNDVISGKKKAFNQTAYKNTTYENGFMYNNLFFAKKATFGGKGSHLKKRRMSHVDHELPASSL
ncbi:hypothetical protein TNCV_4882811 [Trichonephila clavipes]|nr:hypothetical protein TNCV_4882811 [Trichonephila clavipes]